MLMSLVGLHFVLLALSLSSTQSFLFGSLGFVGLAFLNVEGKTRKSRSALLVPVTMARSLNSYQGKTRPFFFIILAPTH